jgi:hypoxanthine phosphoribosyltransferase
MPELLRSHRRLALSAQQVRNVDGWRFHGPVRGEPVLLVDDTVDSRWTLYPGFLATPFA